MMSRVRRTAKQKSPPPMELSERSWATQPARRMLPKIPASTSGSSTSPMFPRKPGGEESRYGGLGGYKDNKQKSLLQSVIHNLVDSTDDAERESQRSKLQNDMEMADERLDELVKEHREKLHGTVSTFQAVDEKMKESQAKIRKVRASLSSCKTLLRCKRDELQRLWLEDVKYKNMLQMIDAIADVKAVPDLLKKYKSNKYYLHATELLNNSVARLEHDLANVDALKDLKVELRLQKESLHEELIDELHRHLYVKATANKLKPVSQLESTSPNSARKGGTLSRVGKISQKSVSPQQDSYRDDDQVIEEMAPGTDLEEDSTHFMAILIESLSILGRVKDALDAIQTRMERELLLIIERASVQIVRAAEQEAVGLLGQGKKRVPINSPKLLTKMLKICFRKFQDVVSAHSVLLVHLHRAKRVYKKNTFRMYEEKDVWGAIQHVLQNALQVYLAFGDDGTPMDTLFGGLAVSGPDFFTSYVRAKKHLTKASKRQFFRFESSRHAISVSSYMREQRDIELVEGGSRTEGITKYADDQPSISQHLVCKPANRNVTVLFGPVREFILVIEKALDLPDGKHCLLYYFLHEYVEENFLERVRYESFTKMGNSVKPETAKTIAPDQKAIKVTAKQYVLNSVLMLWGLVEDLRQLMKDLPMYSTHFLAILSELLIGYRDSLQLFYRELTSVLMDASKGSSGGPETIISSRWARDEDINRMIRSLPNWIRLYQGSKVSRHADDLEKMQSVYAKESQTLTKNLGSDLLRQSHVMLNHENLRLLAVFHESLDWFNSQLKQVVLELTNLSEVCNAGIQTIDEANTDGSSFSLVAKGHGIGTEESMDQTVDLMEQITQFSSIQFEFQSFSETAIITLHLEVRCHCFYYLSSVQKSNYSLPNNAVGEDVNVRKLATDLKDIDQVMVAILSPDKYRYLFEGLGHLVATIFIASAQNMKSINNNGIKKMCGNISLLQSCLSKITLIREKDLDQARRYFELLYLNNEEIIHQLMEQGPKFSQKDYSSALTLLASSHNKYPEDKLKKELKQLDTIFSQDAV